LPIYETTYQRKKMATNYPTHTDLSVDEFIDNNIYKPTPLEPKTHENLKFFMFLNYGVLVLAAGLIIYLILGIIQWTKI